MYFCLAEKCALCFFVEGSVECLRNQAVRYLRLSKAVNSRGLYNALKELSIDLIDEAAAHEKEHTGPLERRR
jgi:hypothetical protein